MAQKASSSRAVALQRQVFALEARRQGKTYQQIADTLGVTKTSAHRYVIKAMDALQLEIGDEAAHLRDLELARLERMHEKAWAKFDAGDLAAGRLVLQVMDRRVRLLGLAAPVKVAPTDTDGNDLDLPADRPRDASAALNELLALVDARGTPMGERTPGDGGRGGASGKGGGGTGGPVKH